MSISQSTDRFALFPQASVPEPGVGRAPVRRYTLARVHAAPRRPDEPRYEYLKRSHD